MSGVAATGPMSAIMVAIHRRLPERKRYPLPPREITTKALDRALGPSATDPEVRSGLTWLAHFGYGGAAGALYALESANASWREVGRLPRPLAYGISVSSRFCYDIKAK